jgi:hypothetical protein
MGGSSFGMAFVISSTPDFSGASGGEYMGVGSNASDAAALNPFIAIELKAVSYWVPRIDRVGIDLNNLTALISKSAGYFYEKDDYLQNFEALMLSSGKPMQVWADYDCTTMELNVTLAPVPMDRPSAPLISYPVNLRKVLGDSNLTRAYMGFSASTSILATDHQVLGWSFNVGGSAEPLNYSLLPMKRPIQDANNMKKLTKWLPATASSLLALLAGSAACCLVLRRWRKKRAEGPEDWEAELGPRRFSHKVLRAATNGFASTQLLGKGGFGSVYGGVLATSGLRVAVKRISSGSKQGLAQFTAEIIILGRLRHRNLVRLIGYCRHKDELLLVYEQMPNGSLDTYLHGVKTKSSLIWSQRFRIIKGVASGLLYLHEDWEQVIIHRDVKASNVLLDGEMNGRLGDFGLARLHDHGADAHTTHVAGTRGYLAPELLKFGKATKATDVFAFGAFIMEVACGRRPMSLNARGELLVLVEWVRQAWAASGCIADAMDPRLVDYTAEEAELVLKLGLLCSHPLPAARPGMRLVMQYLDGDLPLPGFSPDYLIIADADQVVGMTPSVATTITSLSGGRCPLSSYIHLYPLTKSIFGQQCSTEKFQCSIIDLVIIGM